MPVSIKTEEELEALKRGGDGERHNAILFIQKLGMYGACFLFFIFAAFLTGEVIYIVYKYVDLLANHQDKLENVVNHSVTFIFGGGTTATVMLAQARLGKKKKR